MNKVLVMTLLLSLVARLSKPRLMSQTLLCLTLMSSGCHTHFHIHLPGSQSLEFDDEMAERKENVPGNDRGRNPWDLVVPGHSD